MTIEAIANAFLAQCETGKGWDACKPFCHPDAGFAAQSEPIAEITTLAAYADWMHGLIVMIPDGAYAVQALATDAARQMVVVYAVFTGTHTGTEGAIPPTGKSAESDYVYAISFRDGLISHMTKIWNSGWAVRQLGWG